MPGDGPKGFAWESAVPADCPFPKSTSLTGVFFTGRHSDYRCGDTWYPCWASDGNLYSPWTDGTTDRVNCSSGSGGTAKTGHGVMIGDDPLRLEIHNTSPPKEASALPYQGRYPAGSLVYNGIWYYGTYCLGPRGSYKHDGFTWNWPNLGPMPGFQISRDYGKTWEPSPLTPEKPLFPEPRKPLGPVKMGAPHFVDFGEQGYFLNFPSKFVSDDGLTLWLCYSANFSPGWNGVKLGLNPPGGCYGLCLQEVKLLTPKEQPPNANKPDAGDSR